MTVIHPLTLALYFVFFGIFALNIWRARTKIPEVRKIGPVEALPDTVGRCVEMGKPVLFSPGGGTGSGLTGNRGAAAAFPVLGHVARICARYECQLITTTPFADHFVIAQSVLEGAYIAEGRPELYKPDDVKFHAEAHAYRHTQLEAIAKFKPGASILSGSLVADSIFWTEAANRAGAMTINIGNVGGGNLAFLLMCSDYVTLGEEYFAASAALSEDRSQLGTLVGQDYLKIIFLILLVIGIIYQPLVGIIKGIR